MKKILNLYSSTDGQTLKISEKIANLLNQAGHETELKSINDFDGELSQYDTVIIGARVRHGKHMPQVEQFINDNKSQLEQMQTAFFSVNLTARNPKKNTFETNPYAKKFLNKINWKADFVEVFAGGLDYNRYSFFDKITVKLVMLISGGPLKTEQSLEFTNWDKVSEFATQIAN